MLWTILQTYNITLKKIRKKYEIKFFCSKSYQDFTKNYQENQIENLKIHCIHM